MYQRRLMLINHEINIPNPITLEQVKIVGQSNFVETLKLICAAMIINELNETYDK